jgi:hypothetical protein
MGTSHHSTLRSDTRTISIQAPADLVFDFLASPENLPQWAVGFCRSIRPGDDEHWLVETTQGDIPIRFVTDRDVGTIDFHMWPAPGVEAIAFSRVVPNGEGTEYLFTQFQSAAMPDDVFEQQVRALIEEMQVLKALLQARIACPI